MCMKAKWKSQKLSPLNKMMENQSSIPSSLRLIVSGFNNTSTCVGHFVSSPREREKRARRDSRGDERERKGRMGKMNEREETEEIKTSHLYPCLLQG